jgi:AcrR family transcriptional regulator
MNVRRGRGGAARTQGERSDATRAALIGAARPLFAERGYAEVGTEEIVRAAGLTRGALYHQFGGKRELFEAVYTQVEHELAEQIAAEALRADDPLGAMQIGIAMLLDACLRPEVQRIALIDAPAVLGWERFREIGAGAGLGLIENTLEAAMQAGVIARQPSKPLAHVVMGALDEAAMLVGRSEDPPKTRTEVAAVLQALLDGLRI